MKLLSDLSAKLKSFVDWLDMLPGVGAFGVGVAVALFLPLPPVSTLMWAAVAYVVLKLDIGNLGTKLSNWFGGGSA